jgi:transcriptional regulator GlxA family with amidase domain
VERHGAVHGPDDGSLLLALRRLRQADGQRAVHAFVAEVVDWLERRRDAGLSPVELAAESLARDPFRDWSVKRLAAAHGVSREHLSEVFRERFGAPPGAWLLERRLAYARELLSGTGLPVAEVARRCGLVCARRLSRALKRSAGVPASGLR